MVYNGDDILKATLIKRICWDVKIRLGKITNSNNSILLVALRTNLGFLLLSV